ncbi:unnamed protein product [Vitrella brassicaformis CCMP3155]|uniref:Uncharacterized protein n=1 Tax=Vitrella brassicaformis (strain CCMP3155) TaxID=1169540 RepID=A0A0G4ES59_VITBC|nr:unnamed protein product [Vitrella brassicaformis CCMP3155]|mmetsp:Transcript_37040/g.92897  ORF Transcript_37040/g.92897 Transcript_37040/m.92897 type:complete len:100 (+) Transcript_37040:122-421(+)|eukprot:CEM00695.1 unnamed protein product [Vitrella brassicaformis CCMP3155]
MSRDTRKHHQHEQSSSSAAAAAAAADPRARRRRSTKPPEKPIDDWYRHAQKRGQGNTLACNDGPSMALSVFATNVQPVTEHLLIKAPREKHLTAMPEEQ